MNRALARAAILATGSVVPLVGVLPAASAAPSPSPASENFQIQFPGVGDKPSSSVLALLGLTVLAVAPALLLMCTSFTKIIVVLSLTRNALGLQSVPPNQVLAGLALFLSLFVMGPVVQQVNHLGIQPYIHGEKNFSQAYDAGVKPLRTFMLAHTRQDQLALMVSASKQTRPASPTDVTMSTLVPAFILSELRSAFIIGFVIFVPFLIIDIVVSASLMSLGMMMLPPVMISLPFKLLLFVLMNGWGLIVTALVTSYR